MARVVIFSNRSSTWGLAQDAKLVEQVLRECHATRSFLIQSIDHHDPVAFTNPKPVDIQIHLEVPCRLAWPWAKVNIVVVNPEWWPRTAWDWALAAADLVVFKSPSAAAAFPEVPVARRCILSWRPPALEGAAVPKKENKVLYLVGGSVHKAAAAKQVVSAWKAEWPPLEVWGAPAVLEPLQAAVEAAKAAEGRGGRIVWNTAYKTDAEKFAAQSSARFHCVASAAEGFGYTMAESALVGSLPLWTGLPVFEDIWGSVLGATGKIAAVQHEVSTTHRQGPRTFSVEALDAAMASLLALSKTEEEAIQQGLQRKAIALVTEWRTGWKGLLKQAAPLLKRRPQPLQLQRLPASELPKVAIVTVTRNRPRWFANMTRNILGQDYPSEKLVWVIVDDGDAIGGRVDQDVLKFRQKAPQITTTYISLPNPLTVGEKRNRGCAAAVAAGAEVLVMMDDDDHYPRASLEARVTYLRLLGKGCVYCGRIQMYDCRRYISAMNVSPMDLSPAERVSEATLAFTRAFWEARPFPSVSVAEGAAFLTGRDAETAEIPPESVIVSFLHGKNSTSRRVPQSSEANGCHYGFDDDFFLYLCDLGGAPDVAGAAV